MKRTKFFAASLLLIGVCHQAKAELFRTVFTQLGNQVVALREGRHKVADDVDGYTEITETENGFLFEIKSFDKLDRLPLVVDWESDSDEPIWNLVQIERMELDGVNYLETPPTDVGFYLQTTLRFDPWIRPGQNAFEFFPFDSAAYPARSDLFAGTLRLGPCFNCPPMGEPPHEIVFEMSVVEMQPPLAADFNYDDNVDFADFLVLSSSFGTRAGDSLANFPIHAWGDANMDFVTDIDDFFILADMYGESRQDVAVVPEPSGGGTVIVVALAVAVGLRRRHRTCFLRRETDAAPLTTTQKTESVRQRIRRE